MTHSVLLYPAGTYLALKPTFDYGVVFFQEFVDEIVDLYSFIGGNHCWIYSLFSTH